MKTMILAVGTTAILALMLLPVPSRAAEAFLVTPVPLTNVKVADDFWAPRIETNRTVSIPHAFKMCTGHIGNFEKAAGLMKGKHSGGVSGDSEMYKVIEGASYSLAIKPDPALELYLDKLIATIAKAQEADGYLYTPRTINPEVVDNYCGSTRWSHKYSHELFNAGHLYEAAVAHYQATGKRSLLDVAFKNADLMRRVFGPGKKFMINHPEIKLALVKLYHVSSNGNYLALAKFLLDERGHAHGRKLDGPECQDHKPLVQQNEAVGHAVAAIYTYTAMTDVGVLAEAPGYVEAADRIWANIVSKKLYLTGAAGARGEAFSKNYDLPNKEAKNETCVAMANAHWNHRLFLLHADAKYLDVLERVLYNGALSSVSLGGNRFFYANPLEHDGKSSFNMGEPKRRPWMGSACCPTFVVRFMPLVGGFVYAGQDNILYINLFIGGSGTVKIRENVVRVRQQTRYPWDGAVKIAIEPEHPAEFAVHVRIPGWAQGRPVPSGLYRYLNKPDQAVMLKVNGKPVALNMEKGFARIQRKWASGDMIDLNLPMPIHRVLSHEEVKANAGRVALERGPIVYCVESPDNGGHVLNLALPDEAKLSSEHRPDLLGGVTVIRGTATASYRTQDGSVTTKPVELTAIPYYAWANRGVGEMAVWLPRNPKLAQPAQ